MKVTGILTNHRTFSQTLRFRVPYLFRSCIKIFYPRFYIDGQNEFYLTWMAVIR